MSGEKGYRFERKSSRCAVLLMLLWLREQHGTLLLKDKHHLRRDLARNRTRLRRNATEVVVVGGGMARRVFAAGIRGAVENLGAEHAAGGHNAAVAQGRERVDADPHLPRLRAPRPAHAHDAHPLGGNEGDQDGGDYCYPRPFG